MQNHSKQLNAEHIANRYHLSRDVQYYLGQRKVWPKVRVLTSKGPIIIPRQDSADTCAMIVCALKRAGATPDEALVLTKGTASWKDMVERGEAEDLEQFIANVYDENLLDPIDPADWSQLPTPVLEWLIQNLIPIGKLSALYGAGAVGKTLIALQIAFCVADGRDFLGMPVRQGRVVLFLAEDDEDDAHRAFKTIAKQYGVKLERLRGRIKIITRFGLDNALGSYGSLKKGPTKLFEQLLQIIRDYKPAFVVLDPLADCFEGNENDRSQVVQFLVGVAGKIARDTGAAVLICAHPSKEGERSGRGDSGSTSWNNKVRGRLLLRRVFNNQGQERDRNARVLEQVKTNFEPVDPISLRWREGILVLDQAVPKSSLDEQKQRIVNEIEAAFGKGRPWSDAHQAGNRWIVPWIEDHLNVRRSKAKDLIRELVHEGESHDG